MTDGQKWRRLMSLMFMGASLRNEYGFFVMDMRSHCSQAHAEASDAVDEMIEWVERDGATNIYHLPQCALGDAECPCVDCEDFRQRRKEQT